MKENQISWENLYSQGESYLEYPNEALIVSYHRIKRLLPQNPVCLDYGFGSGNNTEFLINKVDSLYGIEISEEAKKITSDRLNKYKNFDPSNLIISENKYINELENKFDLIVAWHVISYNTDSSIKEVLKYFYKYLKKDGILITTLATPNDVSKKFSKEISNNTYCISSEIPSQEGCIVVIPKDKEDFQNYFNKFETLDIGHEERVSYKHDDLHSHYYGIFKKV